MKTVVFCPRALLPPANEVFEGYFFTPVCQSFCSEDKEYLGRYPPRQVHPPARYLLGRYSPQAGTPPRQVPLTPWVDTPPQADTPLGGYTPQAGTPSWAGTPPPRAGTPPGQGTPLPMHAGIQSTNGKYASYWNAFLFVIVLKADIWVLHLFTVVTVARVNYRILNLNCIRFLMSLTDPVFWT